MPKKPARRLIAFTRSEKHRREKFWAIFLPRKSLTKPKKDRVAIKDKTTFDNCEPSFCGIRNLSQRDELASTAIHCCNFLFDKKPSKFISPKKFFFLNEITDKSNNSMTTMHDARVVLLCVPQ